MAVTVMLVFAALVAWSLPTVAHDGSSVSLPQTAQQAEGGTLPLELAGGWKSFGREALVLRSEKFCALGGRISGRTWDLIAKVPECCRPTEAPVSFRVVANKGTARLAIEPDGSLRYLSGDKNHAWLRLDSISYACEIW